MTTKEGSIEYDLFTVSGNIKLTVTYTLVLDEEGNPKVGDITVESEEEAPQLEQSQIEELLDLCIEDSLDKEAKEKEEPDWENPGYPVAVIGYEFSVN